MPMNHDKFVPTNKRFDTKSVQESEPFLWKEKRKL